MEEFNLLIAGLNPVDTYSLGQVGRELFFDVFDAVLIAGRFTLLKFCERVDEGVDYLGDFHVLVFEHVFKGFELNGLVHARLLSGDLILEGIDCFAF